MYGLAILMFHRSRVAVAALAETALHHALVPARSSHHDAFGIYCDARWLVHRRDRPPALGDLGHPAHGRRRLACPWWSDALDADRLCMIYPLFITAFLIFALRMIRRGPEAAPDTRRPPALSRTH